MLPEVRGAHRNNWAVLTNRQKPNKLRHVDCSHCKFFPAL